MNEHPSPEFEKELHETLNTPNANPVFIRDLRATLLERSNMKNQTRSFPRLAWGVIAIIVVAVLAISSPQVVEAMKRLWGYVPGIGFVESGNPIRLLSAPVTVEKNGMTITIENGASDSNNTILLEKVDGYIPESSEEITCMENPRLVMPDGSELELSQYEGVLVGGKGDPSGSYHVRYVFEPLPAQTLDATLESPCILGNSVGADFKVQLHFQVAEAGQIMPVIELPKQDVMESTTPQSDPSTDSASSTDSNIEGFSITLESEAQFDDGYLIAGNYQWTDERFGISTLFMDKPGIMDANNQPVAFTQIEPAVHPDPSIKKLPFAYQISGREYAWPLTIMVNSVAVNLQEQGTFQFDAGAAPQVGQEWEVNMDVPVGSHIVHVNSIRLIQGRTPAELGFEFSITTDPTVLTANVMDANPIITGPSEGGGGGGGGGGGSGDESVSSITNGWTIEGYSPAGIKTFVISNLLISVDGTWQVEWQPAAP